MGRSRRVIFKKCFSTQSGRTRKIGFVIMIFSSVIISRCFSFVWFQWAQIWVNHKAIKCLSETVKTQMEIFRALIRKVQSG